MSDILVSDLNYIKDKIRADFDKLDMSDILSVFYADELIERAERFGFKDLVNEMKSDLHVAA